MVVKIRWSQLVTPALALIVASASGADDVFIKEGVIVKPLPKWKQRRIEKKLLKRPGNEVVIEGTPTTTLSPDVLAGVKARRSFRPLFGDRFAKRPEIIVSPPVITSGPATVITTNPGVIVANPRPILAPDDPEVLPGSVEGLPSPRVVRPPVVSTPRGTTPPVEPIIEPDLEPEQPATGQILPPPADEIPPPVVSTPRKASSSPNPAPRPALPAMPAPAPEAPPRSELPSVDPGPLPSPTPALPEPAVGPSLDPPMLPRPA